MGKGQREKGASFERAVALALSGALGRDVKRNLSQSRDGGYDILAGRYVVECKRRKSMKTLYGWMRQVLAAANIMDAAKLPDDDRIPTPVVVCRADNEDALAVMKFSDFLNIVEQLEPK
jgi:hypothetical protein